MADTEKPNETKAPEPKAPEKFPDAGSCLVKRSGFGDYVDCLNTWAWRCPYALGFGSLYLCRHPSGLEMLAREEARATCKKA